MMARFKKICKRAMPRQFWRFCQSIKSTKFSRQHFLRVIRNKKQVNNSIYYGQFYIYLLIDPRDQEVFYVGRSKDPSMRLSQHIKQSLAGRTNGTFEQPEWILKSLDKKRDTKKMKRIQNIIASGGYPVSVVIDSWDVSSTRDANRLEDAWIAEMRRRGFILTNYITSRRQNPNWYNSLYNDMTPEKFIDAIKSGAIKPKGYYIDKTNNKTDIDRLLSSHNIHAYGVVYGRVPNQKANKYMKRKPPKFGKSRRKKRSTKKYF